MRMTEEEYNQLVKKIEERKEKRKLKQQKSKYRSEKITIDNKTFDSRKEADRYQQLLLLEKAGEISKLQCQPSFLLIPTQKDKEGHVIERRCTYYADFSYYDKDGSLVVEDVKSPVTKTPQYRIKKKLMLQLYGIRIKEI